MIDGNDSIADSLKSARLAKGLTQKELGRRVGMPQSHISKIESGGVDLQLSSLTELSRALDLEVTLVPRAAVAAVEGVLRTVRSPITTSRAEEALVEQNNLALRLSTRFPDLQEARHFRKAIHGPGYRHVDEAYETMAPEVMRLTRSIQADLDRDVATDTLKASLRHLTDILMLHHVDRAERAYDHRSSQVPAYRLDEDDV